MKHSLTAFATWAIMMSCAMAQNVGVSMAFFDDLFLRLIERRPRQPRSRRGTSRSSAYVRWTRASASSCARPACGCSR